MYFNGKKLSDDDYCKCNTVTCVTSVEDDEGYWIVCCNCDKPLEGDFHYYNHYDGEDHDDIDMFD